MTTPGAANPAPNSAFGDWFDSLLDPGGNPDALDRQTRQHRQLRDDLTEHAAELSTLRQALTTAGGWSGRTAGSFQADAAHAIERLNVLAHSHDLAATAVAAQAQQKRQQQATAELLATTLVLAAGAMAVVAFAPAAVGVLGADVLAADAVAATTAGEGVEAAAESNALMRALSQVGARMAAIVDAGASFVERLFGDALDALSQLVARSGITRSAWESTRLSTLMAVTGRGLAKAGSTWVHAGEHWSDVLPALVSGFDLASWTASDWVNTALIIAVGPIAAASPLADVVAGLTIPAPLAAAVRLPAGLVAGRTLGAAVDGAWWNGGLTAVGAFGVNGAPLDSPDAIGATSTSTALGTGAGLAAQTVANARSSTGAAGLDGTKLWRLIIAFPADIGIGAGTPTSTAETVTPPTVSAEPPTTQRFRPEFVGGKKMKVEPGESLSEIAERDLGDGNLWSALQKVNPEVVDGHPDLIRPGDELVEPSLPAPPPRKRAR